MNRIFGWSLMFNCATLILHAVSMIHSIFEHLQVSGHTVENRYTFAVVFAYIEIVIIATTSKKIETKLSEVKKSIFSMNGISKEILVIQLHHQNMEVSPLQICKINNEFIVTVRNFGTKRIAYNLFF